MKAAEDLVWDASEAKPYVFKLSGGKDFEIYLPHEILPNLVGADLGQWCMDDVSLNNEPLGNHMTRWANHADVNYSGRLSDVLAIGLHYDGVQYTSTNRAGGAKSVKVASMNIMSARDSTKKAVRIPLFVAKKARFCKCGCGGFDTVQEIFDVVAWSFRCLRDGVMPNARHDGSPWTAYDKVVRGESGKQIPVAGLMQMRGDWEALVEFFRFRFYTSDNFCWMCNATAGQGPLCYTDFSATAPHRSTCLNHQSYVMNLAREQAQPSNIFRCPGFELCCLVVDSMHSADLGCFCDALGSIFYNEVYCKGYYPNKEEGIKALNKQLDKYYRDHPEHKTSKVTPLTLQQIKGKDSPYPVLKAKAAQVRHLAEFGLLLATKHLHGRGAQPESGLPAQSAWTLPRQHRLRTRVQEHLRLQHDMFAGMVRYSAACQADHFDATVCRESMLYFLKSLSSLHFLWRDRCENPNNQPFALRPKSHCLQHLVQDHIITFGSPSQFWCYRDEDFCGAVKSICSKTKAPATLETNVLKKLRILAGLGVRV